MATPSVTIHVCADYRCAWEVELPDGDTTVECATLDEARSLALEFAVRAQPCDLVVRDAYDRVVEHELIGSA